MKNIIFSVLLFLLSISFFAQDSFIKNEVAEHGSSTLFEESKDMYKVVTTSINSGLSEVGSTFFMDKYIMYSSRKTGAIGAGKDENTNNPYNSLYCMNVDKSGNLSKPYFFASVLDSKGNEGGLAFSLDEKIVYYTKSTEGNTKNYQLYKSIFDEECRCTWIEETAVAFNSVNYSIENPAISPDGKKMYFSSNMPGGLGGFDIYVAEINADGMPVNPVNLGNTVNTSNDEKFPYISPTNKEIYFSSNGHNGYGGQDVFVSKIKKDHFTTPLNLGKTINTSADEISFILASKETGYITSNRTESVGSYDIYHFKLKKYVATLKGQVNEKESKIILPNTVVVLMDEDGNEIETQETNETGTYSFEIEPLENYSIVAKKEGYMDFKLPITGTNGDSTAIIELVQKKAEIVKNAISVENIYFDFNKATIRPESTPLLNKVVEVLTANAEMKVVVNAHTDSRGTDQYNLTLSQKRAAVIKQYLLQKGLKEDRIESNGYGETKSLSDCKANCTEAQFNADRRIEFLIK